MRNSPQKLKEQTRVDRRQAPRKQVGSRVQVGLKRVTPAFRAQSEPEVDADWYMALVRDISERGMCITTDEPMETSAFVIISVIQSTRLAKRKRYSGVIVWGTPPTEKETYRYGIEFVSSWIRHTLYRKHKKKRSTSKKGPMF